VNEEKEDQLIITITKDELQQLIALECRRANDNLYKGLEKKIFEVRDNQLEMLSMLDKLNELADSVNIKDELADMIEESVKYLEDKYGEK
jgi:hypothetical protein